MAPYAGCGARRGAGTRHRPAATVATGRPALLMVFEEFRTVLFLPALRSLAVLAGLAVFFWKRDGPASGRVFGNRIAAHIGMSKHVFHALLDNGVGCGEMRRGVRPPDARIAHARAGGRAAGPRQ
jgi:hypothetical protein